MNKIILSNEKRGRVDTDGHTSMSSRHALSLEGDRYDDKICNRNSKELESNKEYAWEIPIL